LKKERKEKTEKQAKQKKRGVKEKKEKKENMGRIVRTKEKCGSKKMERYCLTKTHQQPYSMSKQVCTRTGHLHT
jgi:hypothetical protein